jgi:predicted dehydrogenase
MKKINTALLSYGMSGKVFHAPFINEHECFQLLGSWERSKKLIQRDYENVISYPTIESLLSDDQVELVIVNTPTYTHYEYANKALLAGKHVIVEKAFTTTVSEAVELKNIATSKNVKLSVFQNRRWDSDFQTVRNVIREGLLGDIVEATISYDRYNPALSPKLHKENPGPGAGIVYDLGPHLIDQALFLFGMPRAIFADIMVTREKSLVDDYFEILLYYDKLRVRLRSGYFVKELIPSFVIHGKNGTFLKSRADVQEAQLQQGIKPSSSDYGIEANGQEGLINYYRDETTIKSRVPTIKGNYMAYFDGICRAIRSNEPLPVTADDGINTLKIIQAAIESSGSRKAIDVK